MTRYISTDAMATTTMPSLRPVNPMCSLVVAFTPTCVGATPMFLPENFLHLRNVRRHLRRLGDDHRVHVIDASARLAHALGAFAHDDHAVHVLELHVAGRVILPDVAERRRAQQRVGDGMRQHVGVAVAFQTDLVRDFHAADDALAARGKPMHVDSNSNAVHKILELTLLANPKQRRENAWG